MTQSYLTDEDAPAKWIEETFILDTNSFTSIKLINENWEIWCLDNQESLATSPTKELRNRGFQEKRGAGGVRGFIGFRLKKPTQQTNRGET